MPDKRRYFDALQYGLLQRLLLENPVKLHGYMLS